MSQALIQALGDPDWQIRKRAARRIVDAIATGGGDLAAYREPLLAALAQRENVGLRNAAIEVLGKLGEASTSALIEAYTQAEWETRKFILDALGATRDVAAVPTVLDALATEHDNLRAAACEALTLIGGPEAERALADMLSPERRFEAMAALDGLTRLGARLDFAQLSALLDDAVLRRGATRLLGRCGDVRALEPLLAALTSGSPRLAGEACCALVDLSTANDPCEAAVKSAAANLDASARAALMGIAELDSPAGSCAARVGIWARSPELLPQVLRLAEDGALDADALSPLREWGSPLVGHLLALGERPGPLGGIALELAADLCPDDGPVDELRASLRRALQGPDEVRAEAAARGMVQWSQPSDAARLVGAARHAEERVARACANALAQLGQRDPGPVLEALSGETLEGSFGAAMARVAAAIPGATSRELLTTGLNARDPRARRAAVQALGQLEDAADVLGLGFALTDEDRVVQRAAAHSLATAGDAHGAELLAALHSEDPGVRAAAAAGISDSTAPQVRDRLAALAMDDDDAVAIEALLALGRVTDPRLVELASAAAKRPEAERRKAALTSLAAGSPEALRPLAEAALSDDAWDVRATAAQALSTLGLEAVRECLEAHLARERDETVRDAIAALLGNGIGG